MNAKQKISILTVATVALVVSYWSGYIHGSGVLTLQDTIASIALPIILIWTLTKLTLAFFFRRGSVPPSNGGSEPPTAPSPGVRVPRPPGAPPEIYCEHAA